MTELSPRSVELERIGTHLFRATNSRGTTLTFGPNEGADFTPIELLLVAIGGCTGLDVEYIVGKRAEPETFTVSVRGDKIRDEGGNRMTNVEVSFQVAFPEGPDGDAARDVLPSALQKSHDRLCTVSRTVELGTPVRSFLADA